MTLFGWDASHYDDERKPLSPGDAALAGISFFTHKLTEGTTYVDTRGAAAITQAMHDRVPFVGPYVVPRTAGSVAAQADWFVRHFPPGFLDYAGAFFQVDTEKWGNDAVSAQRGHDVLRAVEARTGLVGLHYAPKWAYGDSVPAGPPLWGSSYVSGAGSFEALYPGDGSSRWAPYSGRAPRILQYTSSARIGQHSPCDANAFRGSHADFAAMIKRPGASGAPAPVEGGDDMAQKYWIGQVRKADGTLDPACYLTDLMTCRWITGPDELEILQRNIVDAKLGDGVVHEWSEAQFATGFYGVMIGAAAPGSAPAGGPAASAAALQIGPVEVAGTLTFHPGA